MGGGGKSGGSGDSTTTVRFAPYIESYHENFLADMAFLVDYLDDVGMSPYGVFTAWDVEDAFFGVGYMISSFPSLYDMYGKFMAGLDVDALFDQIFLDSTSGPLITNLVSEQAVELSDDIEQVADPRFVTGMRDINSVVSSTFVVGRAMMETARTKALSKFDAELRYRMIPVAADRWKTHLMWNEAVPKLYAEMIKLYVSARMDAENHSLEIAAKHALWPITVNLHMGNALGALTGAKTVTEDVQGASKASKALGGAMSGAAGGFMVGGPWGALAGGVLGLAGGLLD